MCAGVFRFARAGLCSHFSNHTTSCAGAGALGPQIEEEEEEKEGEHTHQEGGNGCCSSKATGGGGGGGGGIGHRRITTEGDVDVAVRLLCVCKGVV